MLRSLFGLIRVVADLSKTLYISIFVDKDWKRTKRRPSVHGLPVESRDQEILSLSKKHPDWDAATIAEAAGISVLVVQSILDRRRP